MTISSSTTSPEQLRAKLRSAEASGDQNAIDYWSIRLADAERAMVELRVRPEPRRSARHVGTINDARDILGDMHGWLVLADLGDPDHSVLELRTLPGEAPRDAADRLARAGLQHPR